MFSAASIGIYLFRTSRVPSTFRSLLLPLRHPTTICLSVWRKAYDRAGIRQTTESYGRLNAFSSNDEEVSQWFHGWRRRWWLTLSTLGSFCAVSSSLTRAFGSGYRRAQWGLTGDLLLHRVKEGDAYFVGTLMSGMARCAKDMVLSAGSDEVIRAGKTNFVDGSFGAAFKTAGLISLPGCQWSQLHCSFSRVEALCIV